MRRYLRGLFQSVRGSRARKALLVLLPLVLAACTSGGEAVRDVAVATGLRAEAPRSAEFVAQSRPSDLNYMPIGVQPPARAIRPRSADEAERLKQELEARRRANEAAASEARALSAAPAAQ
ncbi:hypothetical protein IMF23_03090 [Chelatococcus daeguensis]|uniref:Beta-barrel assembly machine subunit BamF n=1 Tax=Chelatococcus sambhunathii TaxID=363953 RepID=A0ABP2A3C5_9HYPH|nr:MULTISPECIES: hypothetical protein [Chelatococcus]MBM3082415.1 hypothetical protein [Chelatococcus daeguensis]CUA85378.1 hypothetical protein Ga0061061_10250 [Chelatococcus sambhunathii]